MSTKVYKYNQRIVNRYVTIIIVVIFLIHVYGEALLWPQGVGRSCAFMAQSITCGPKASTKKGIFWDRS
jgi:hypothetical protein